MKTELRIRREDDKIVSADLWDIFGAESLVIFLHNFPKIQNSDDDLFHTMRKEFLSEKFCCLFFDYTGHVYDQDDTDILTLESASQDIQAVINWAREHGFKKFIFVAEGMGASLVYKNMPDDCFCYIMLWPAFDLGRIGETLFDREGEPDINRVLRHEVQNLNMSHFLQKNKVPTLILHGEQDEMIPPDIHLEYARQHLMGRRIEITVFQDGKHGLSEEKHQKNCIMHAMRFIKKYAAIR